MQKLRKVVRKVRTNMGSAYMWYVSRSVSLVSVAPGGGGPGGQQALQHRQISRHRQPAGVVLKGTGAEARVITLIWCHQWKTQA